MLRWALQGLFLSGAVEAVMPDPVLKALKRRRHSAHERGPVDHLDKPSELLFRWAILGLNQ